MEASALEDAAEAAQDLATFTNYLADESPPDRRGALMNEVSALLEFARRNGRLGTAAIARVHLSYIVEDVRTQRALAEEALRMTAGTDRVYARALAYERLAKLELQGGDLSIGQALLERAIAEATTENLLRELYGLEHLAGAMRLAAGEFRPAVDRFERAIRLARALAFTQDVGRSIVGLAAAEAFLGVDGASSRAIQFGFNPQEWLGVLREIAAARAAGNVGREIAARGDTLQRQIAIMLGWPRTG
jgi:tetratricopeptide (TPR) repeat protein